MRQVDNPELFTCEEMTKNIKDAAEAAAGAYDDYDDYAYAYAAYAYAAYSIDIYFKNTGENKENYIKEVERLK